MINQDEVLFEYNKLKEFMRPYLKNSLKIRDERQNSAVRKEFSVKGETIHRGFYCPSPVFDIVVGNCNRGNLLNRLTSRSKPNYIYYYDENNRITVVEKHHSLGTDYELLWYVDNAVMSVGFENGNRLGYYTKCVYDGEKILSYDYYKNLDYRKNIDTHFLGCEYYEADKCIDYRGETYRYIDGTFKAVDIDTVTVIIVGMETIHRKTYSFKLDNEGYLSTYFAEDRWFTQNKNHSVNEYEYEVNLKRKI